MDFLRHWLAWTGILLIPLVPIVLLGAAVDGHLPTHYGFGLAAYLWCTFFAALASNAK